MSHPSEQTLSRLRRATHMVLFWTFVVSAGLNLLMLTSPLYMLQVYDRVIAARHVDTLIYLTVMAVGALVVLGLLDHVRATVGLRLGAWLERELAGALIQATVTAPQASGINAGRGVPALRDLAVVRGLFAGGGIWPLLDAPWSILFYAVVFLIHPWLGWCGVAGGALLVMIAVANELAIRAQVREAGQSALRAMGEADAAVRNADALLAMGMLPQFVARWQRLNEAALVPQARAGGRTAALAALARLVRMSLQVASLALGAYLTIRGELTGGTMVAASIIVARAVAPPEQAIGAWRSIVAAQMAWQRVKALLRSGAGAVERIHLPRPAGTLVADKVSYAGGAARDPIIRQASFTLAAGESLAIVGPSGAGKTTLLRLLVGSLAPQLGAVRLDGAAIDSWALADKAHHVGYLPQDVELFNATVRDNIARFGDASDGAVVEAAILAGAHETILRLPQGYATMLGPDGVALSGGQRQRIGLARALFGDPRLVVLDEPNANLDPDGEQALIAALRALRQRRVSVVLVTHRLSLTAGIDKVLNLREGRVEAFGPRDELLPALVPATARGRLQSVATAAGSD
ncbi:type I secretion system permease/ATPase [Vineibacter terrae]|uniref:type I secretion system permease/ATPase n=1 Tax=Vineibacter terrae TaxID=2586908 RepID=UPI0015B6BA75|nr:type I secretion system permease/ATPase [Vineibacter terrae]